MDTIFQYENMWIESDNSTGLLYLKVSDYYETGVCEITKDTLLRMLKAIDDNDNKPLYVLAGTCQSAKDYGVRYHKKHPSKVISVSSHDKLCGIRGGTLYVTKTAWGRDNYHEIIERALVNNMEIIHV